MGMKEVGTYPSGGVPLRRLPPGAQSHPAGHAAAKRGRPERDTAHPMRFALTKFRPTTLPTTLVARPALLDQLTAGAGQRLTVVIGSAGAGKSVLLSSWSATRPDGATSWLSCDEGDANPVRFWAGFIETIRTAVPGFGADAADLLETRGVMSADAIASIANDAAELPAGSAIVVDDFHYAALAVSRHMTDLVERWPAGAAQLVLSCRADPALRLHRLRMSGELRELRDRDLYFSLAESRDLLANFDVQLAAADLARLHQRSEGWAAALQMAALSLRGSTDPVRAARAIEVGGHPIIGYFVAEILERQPAEVARFMLDTSVLGELTADACTAVTGRQDAAALLHGIEAANLFLEALDDERTRFRYHRMVRRALRAELRARDQVREQTLQLRAAEWFEATGAAPRAARHFLAAKQVDRALAIMQHQVVTDFLRDPALPTLPDLAAVRPSLLADSPDRLLALATDLLLSGDLARGSQYLELLEHVQPSVPPGSELAVRLAVARALRYMLTGQAAEAAAEALAARAIQERARLAGDWNAAVSLILLRVCTWLEDFRAVEREAAAIATAPGLTEPVTLVMVPGLRALAWFESGYLTEAAESAGVADAEARRLGLDQHFLATAHLRVLAGLALERRDFDTAEQLTDRALAARGRQAPVEFLTLLDRAEIQAARGQVRDALATVAAARPVLTTGTGSALLERADELEALLRLSLGDRRSPAGLASRLSAARRVLLEARIALASDDHHAARELLRSPSLDDLTPRRALARQLLLAAAAIGLGDPMTASILAGALETARRGGFCNAVVTAAPPVTSYLVQHSSARADPYLERLTAAAVEARGSQGKADPRYAADEALTAAESRVLKLLPTNTSPQIAAILYVSRSTVKTHLQSIYRKLGATSRSEALERAVDLRLL